MSDFKNATRITTRRYKQTFGGFWVPTKKIIAITGSIWSRLADNMHLITNEIYIQPGELFMQPKIIENEEYFILQRMIRRGDTHFYTFCPSGCLLSMNKWNTLKGEYGRISAAVLDYTYEHLLMQIILKASENTTLDPSEYLKVLDPDLSLILSLSEVFKEEIERIVNTILQSDKN